MEAEAREDDVPTRVGLDVGDVFHGQHRRPETFAGWAGELNPAWV